MGSVDGFESEGVPREGIKSSAGRVVEELVRLEEDAAGEAVVVERSTGANVGEGRASVGSAVAQLVLAFFA